MRIADFLSNRRILFPALAVSIVVLGGLYYFTTRGYTIAVVEGESVPLNRFSKNYRAASDYYEALLALAAQAAATSSPMGAKMSEQDIKATVLDQMIEAVLIDHEAREELSSELDGMVEERVAQYKDDESLEEAVGRLYNFSKDDFVEEVLVPQAKADILRGRLFLKGETFDAWLVNAKKEADVAIFSDEFRWDGAQVIAE